MNHGIVYLIGAGPGDIGLFTIKGMRCLQKADAVVYDFHLNSQILTYIKHDAEFIYAGKRGGHHAMTQDQINQALVDQAKQGKTVCRLKGGDPFVFGRGGEEAEVLAAEGIPFEIIPGVSSSIAAPAYAGIPLTHRKYSSSFAVITGNEDATKSDSTMNWDAIAKSFDTLVFLMGVKNIYHITESLITQGKSPSTPAALIRWGTTPRQEILTGTLDTIVDLAQTSGFAPPAILVVGKVVDLRNTLQWFDIKPLFGKGVVITRPERQADDLARLLEKEGAQVISFPTIKIIPPRDWSSLDAALNKLDAYNWIIFTSANGVHYFFERLGELKKDVRDLKGIKVCCIGPATAAQVAKKGIQVDLVPEDYISEGILQSFAAQNLQGQKILIPRAARARDVLPEGLGKMGAAVDVVVAYETVNSGKKKEELLELFQDNRIDVLTFTSSSTVTNFLEIMGRDFTLPPRVRVACIGPVTEATARKAGFCVDIQQEKYTIDELVQSLVLHFKSDQRLNSGKKE